MSELKSFDEMTPDQRLAYRMGYQEAVADRPAGIYRITKEGELIPLKYDQSMVDQLEVQDERGSGDTR